MPMPQSQATPIDNPRGGRRLAPAFQERCLPVPASAPDFAAFVADYYARFAQALHDFDKGPLAGVLGVLDAVAAAGGTLWLAGNGGSAAIADHSVCDISKGTYAPGKAPLRAVSLAANGPLLTALGNDIAYADVFAAPLQYYLTERDAVLLVSSSGNSENVVRACQAANDRGVPTIAFTGFSGGRLKQMARHVVHVPVTNYGIVEDIHQSLIHVLTQYIARRAA